MTIIVFLIFIVAAYWVYNDARERGHDAGSAAMWGLGTLVMFVVFLPLYLVFGRKSGAVPKERPVIDIEGVPVEEIMDCPMCGKKVKDDLITCPYCGYTLKPKCAKCGQELNRQWRICPYCETPADPK